MFLNGLFSDYLGLLILCFAIFFFIFLPLLCPCLIVNLTLQSHVWHTEFVSFKICHQLELNENSLFLGLIVVVSNRSGLGLMASRPAWNAGNLIAKLAMKIALLYWCATSWPCQMRLVGASFTTIWSTYTVVEMLILFLFYLWKIIE